MNGLLAFPEIFKRIAFLSNYKSSSQLIETLNLIGILNLENHTIVDFIFSQLTTILYSHHKRHFPREFNRVASQLENVSFSANVLRGTLSFLDSLYETKRSPEILELRERLQRRHLN